MKQREIKFRVWGDTDYENPTMEYDPQWSHTSDCRLSTWFSMSGYHAMQFTGLHDKNGVEIYEGDIVEFIDNPTCCYSGKYEVIIDAGYIGLTKHDLPLYNIEPHKWCIILGNIYQHPHLLK